MACVQFVTCYYHYSQRIPRCGHPRLLLACHKCGKAHQHTYPAQRIMPLASLYHSSRYTFLATFTSPTLTPYHAPSARRASSTQPLQRAQWMRSPGCLPSLGSGPAPMVIYIDTRMPRLFNSVHTDATTRRYLRILRYLPRLLDDQSRVVAASAR